MESQTKDGQSAAESPFQAGFTYCANTSGCLASSVAAGFHAHPDFLVNGLNSNSFSVKIILVLNCDSI